ncbi:MAG: hypothetical protein KIH62_004630 [Candidatus Kerfeldbacteria bacterium]|nr:hypothetical protein [Candidatus Kerfeldbacteria bacterium]
MYGWLLEHFKPINTELLQITEGSWRVYPKGSDHMKLVDDIKQFGTGWCTRGPESAKAYIQGNDRQRGGDMHLFFSNDADGHPTIPRVSMVVVDGLVSEVRGIESKQNVDARMLPVVETKLLELPHGERFLPKLRDMQQFNRIESLHESGGSLDAADLRFLHEFDRKIEGFGIEASARIVRLQKRRNRMVDMRTVFDAHELDQIVHAPAPMTSRTRVYIGEWVANTVADVAAMTSLRWIEGTVKLQYPIGVQEAMQLVECGAARSVAIYIEHVQGPNHELAMKLIERGEGLFVLGHLLRYSGIDYALLSLELLKHCPKYIPEYIDYFPDEYHSGICRLLCLAGYNAACAVSLRLFKKLNKECAKMLIDDGFGLAVFDNVRSFVSMDYDHLARRLIADGQCDRLMNNLDQVYGLSREVVQWGLENGYVIQIAKHLGSFSDVPYDGLVLRLISSGKKDLVAAHIGKYTQLNVDTARIMLAEFPKELVLSNLHVFDSRAHPAIAEDVLAQAPELLPQYLGQINGIDEQKYVFQLIHMGLDPQVVQHVATLKRSDHYAIAQRLVAAGHIQDVSQHRACFQNLPKIFVDELPPRRGPRF